VHEPRRWTGALDDAIAGLRRPGRKARSDRLDGPLLVSNFLVLVASTARPELLSPFTGRNSGDRHSRRHVHPAGRGERDDVCFTNEAQLVALR
jgi:hypothetical protein